MCFSRGSLPDSNTRFRKESSSPATGAVQLNAVIDPLTAMAERTERPTPCMLSLIWREALCSTARRRRSVCRRLPHSLSSQSTRRSWLPTQISETLQAPREEFYGGTGYADATSNGGVMRTGVFYRSMALSNLGAADWTTLSSLHIVLDIDLRTPRRSALRHPTRTDPTGSRRELFGSTSISWLARRNRPRARHYTKASSPMRAKRPHSARY